MAAITISLSSGVLTINLGAANDQIHVRTSGSNITVSDGSNILIDSRPAATVQGLVVQGNDSAGQTASLDGVLSLPSGVVVSGVVQLQHQGDYTVSSYDATVSQSIVVSVGLSQVAPIQRIIANGASGIALTANQQSPASTGIFAGINVFGATLSSVSSGPIQLTGRGGDTGSNIGVQVAGGSVVSTSGIGGIILNGNGGTGANSLFGVRVTGAGTAITTATAGINITGTGGPATGDNNYGVTIASLASITSGGSGSITITGTGGGTGASIFNYGIYILGGATVSAGGSLNLNGVAGPGGIGVFTFGGGTTSAGSLLVLQADSIENQSTPMNGNQILIQPATLSLPIVLGGADAPGTLGISNTDLALMTAPGVFIANGSFTGGITVVGPITAPAGWSQLNLRNSGTFTATAAGSLNVPQLTFFYGAISGHTWTITPSSVQMDAAPPIPYSSTTSLTVTSGSGSDTFNVTPSPTTAITVNGNFPIPPASPGDTLAVNMSGATNPVNTDSVVASGHTGTYTFSNRQTVTYAQIETILTATHFSVSAPASVTAGAAFSFTVTALDQFNNPFPGYGGVVHFTSSDGQAVLPGDSTLTNGAGTFSATLKTAGNQTITATDTITASITGTSGSITVAPAAATHFAVSAPASVTAGSSFSFTVTALDQFNNTATGYAGIVHFTSSDGQAVLPSNSTLVSGTGTFSATLKTAGNQTITATDTVTPSVTGTSSAIAVGPAAATHFAVSAPASVVAGSAFSFTVTALDQFNNMATGYAGTVHFTSSDGQAVLPPNSTLVSGTGTFSATLKTAGNQTITATDTVTASITGTSGAIAAGPATATHFAVSAPASAAAGSAFSFTVTALDQFNNTATGYAGTVHFTSSDGQAVLPANSTLVSGTGTFSATLRTAGNQTITATDTVTSSITGTSAPIAVSPAAATHFAVTAPASATAGAAFSFTVTALDAFNNTATAYAGTVHFTSTDGLALLPPNFTLTSGSGTFSATLATGGNQTITATDTVTASINGTSAAIAVTPVADLAITKTGPASANPGTNVTYSIAISNNGPSNAQTVTLTDALPAGTTFVSEAQPTGPAFVCSNPPVGSAGTITCTIATLPLNATATFTIVLQTSTGNFSNVATIASATSDPNTTNNNATAITGINTADLAITKTASAPLLFGGQNVTYTITVTNNGPATATSVSISDVIPAGSAVVSTAPPGICTGTSTVTCSIATLPNGASTAITLVLVTPAAGGVFTNTATVTAAQLDSNTANNSATATVTLQPASAIPTLSDYALLLMVAALGLIAVGRLR